MESCCSTSSGPVPLASPANAAGDKGGWKHTVLTELRRKNNLPEGADATVKVQIVSGLEGPHAVAAKRLDSTCSTVSSATQPASPAPRPRTPSKYDYTWIRIIGAGSFGRVSLARHQESGRVVAIKTLNKKAVIRENQVSHVLDERRMLGKVAGHPFIINLLTTFQDIDNLYLVMDYVAGGEFFTHMRDHGRIPEEHARFYTAQIVLALEHLHAWGIAYRDLKPENLLIGADGYVRLTDLGFAKQIKGRSYTMCGTPDYLAPEVISGVGHTPAVDWWSLGCVIYEMLHGFPPFYTGNAHGTYARIMEGQYTLPEHMGPWAQDLISKLLIKEPHKRLGCGSEGVASIKRHKWFQNLEWEFVAAKAYQPPFLPVLTSADDTRNFDKCDNLPPLETGRYLSLLEQELFKPFAEDLED